MPGTGTPPLQVGIVGTGLIGPVHARSAIRAGGVIAGVAGLTPADADEAAAAWGAERGYASTEDLLGDNRIDVVHICAPNDLHVKYARMALEAGKHVICEKPLAPTAIEAAELTECAQFHDRVAAVPFGYRYHAMAAQAREQVLGGHLGQVRLIHGSYLQDWLMSADTTNWRVSSHRGGRSRAFADIGSHWCDLIEWVTGAKIVSLSASMHTAVKQRVAEKPTDTDTGAVVDTEDAAVLMFRTNQAALGSVVISQVSPGRKNRLWFEIDGSEHSVVFDQENPDSLWVGGPDGAQILMRGAATTGDAARLVSVPAGHPQGFLDAFAAFVSDVYATIRGEDVPAPPSFADAWRQCQITEAVLESAGSGAWVSVPT